MTTTPTTSSSSSSIQLVANPPFQASQFESFQPSRFDHIYLYDETNKTHYRYHLRIVDCPTTATTTTTPTAVFLIPAGRESEYMFSSLKGLWSVAESAQCTRLIAVALGRYHTFHDETQVTAELTWIIQLLGQQGRFLPSSQQQQKQQSRQQHQQQRRAHSRNVAANAANHHNASSSIPILKMDGIGQRNIVAQGESTWSGQYLIEQVKLGDRMVRRLYFMDNPFVIQSEVVVVMLPTTTSSSPSLPLLENVVVVDKSELVFEYHHYMAAGILALTSTSKNRQNGKPENGDNGSDLDHVMSGLIIGLGGAGLVNFLQFILEHQATLTVIELDPTVVTVAETYFGFTTTTTPTTTDTATSNNNNTRVIVGDGLQVQASNIAATAATGVDLSSSENKDEMSLPAPTNNINDATAPVTNTAAATTPIVFAEQSFSFIVIDVDSKDKTVGMSCPPLEFCQAEYLQQLKRILKPNGILAMNVSARDPKLFHQVCRTIQTVFGNVILASQDDDDDDDDEENHHDKNKEKVVNVALFARRTDCIIDASPPRLTKTDLEQAMHQSLGNSRRKLGDEMLSTLKSCLSSFSFYKEENNGVDEDVNASGDGTNPGKKKKKKKKSHRKKGKR